MPEALKKGDVKMRFMMTIKRVRASHVTPNVTDGPFAETKELISGYASLRAESKDKAIKLGKALTGVVGPSKEVRFEIRQLSDQELENS
jgi:hypothetical protein